MEHPLKRWMITNKVSMQEVLRRMSAAGWKTSRRYLDHVLKGRKGVSWENAKILSAVTGTAIPASEFMEFHGASDNGNGKAA